MFLRNMDGIKVAILSYKDFVRNTTILSILFNLISDKNSIVTQNGIEIVS